MNSSSSSSASTPTSTTIIIDNEKLQQFMGKVLSDFNIQELEAVF
jgi:hypothetical protein